MDDPAPFEPQRALERLEKLLAIPGPSGEEAAVRDFLTLELERIGVPRSSIREDGAASRIDLPCQAGNVVVRLPGTVPGPRRLLCAHMDTVPLASGAEPVHRGGRIVPAGRTALGGDDRTGVAAVVAALDEILGRGLSHGPLTILFTVREETGVRGARALHPEELSGVALGFNLDGRDPATIGTGAIGKTLLDVEVRGIAAHAGLSPERGVSAVAIFAAAVERLEREGWLGAVDRPEGRGASNIGVVRGGDATNVVTDHLVARGEARSHDAELLRRIGEAYGRAFSEAAARRRSADGRAGSAELRATEAYAAYRLREEEPVVQAAVTAVRCAGLTPRLKVADGGADANWLVRHGVPTVSLGCGVHRSHTLEEYVSIDEFLSACRVALEIATGCARRGPG